MKIKFSLVAALLVSLALFSSCKDEYEAQKAAVSAKIIETMGEVQNLNFSSFEPIGQTTIGKEIEMRTDLFKTKLEQDQKFFDMYQAGGILGKAAQKKRAIERDQLHLTQLDSIRNSLGGRLEEIAYTDYKFSAAGKLKDSKLEAKDWYVAISPTGEVLNMVPDPKKLHRGLGVTIPGYKGMFDEE